MNETILAAIRRVKPCFPGARFIVFGSRARGDERPDSDLDVYVVFPELEGDTLDTIVRVSKALHTELDMAIDILVADELFFSERTALSWSLERVASLEGIAV